MDWLTWLILGERWPNGATLQETSWSLRAVPAWWLLTPLLLLAISGIVWFYRREKLSRLARATLIGLRVAIVLVLGLLLCRPTLEATLQTRRPRPVVLLIDNSLSMATKDPRTSTADRLRLAIASGLIPLAQGIAPDASVSQVPDQTPDALTRADLVRLAVAHPGLKLLEELGKQGPVQIKLFGQGVTSSNPTAANQPLDIPGFTAGEPASALGDALLSLISVDAEIDRPAAIVVLSDGVEQNSQVALEQAAQKCKQLHVPLHCYGIGSSELVSLQIKSVTLPDALFMEDTANPQIAWRANGLKGDPLSIALTLGDVVVARKEIPAKNGEHITETIPFAVPKSLRADGPVDFGVTITGPALADAPLPVIEFSKRVRLVDRKVRVLLVDQTPRFEAKFLMATLLRDRRVEPAFHFTGNDPAGMQTAPFVASLPSTRSELFQYDLIFLGDVPPEVWGQERLTWLRDLVREGAGLVFIAGRRHTPAAYMKTPLAEVIPVESADTMPPFDDTLQTEAYQPVLSAAGQRHEMLALADQTEENLAIWRNLAPLYGAFPVQKLRPGAVALMNHPTRKAGDAPLPVIALQRYGRGQVLFLGMDETWRWRADVGDKYFNRFWGQVVYQLGLPRLLGGARRVQFSLERTEQHIGQPGFVYVRAYDNDYQPLMDAKLQAKVVPLDRTGKPSGEAYQPLTLEAIPGQPGEYRALLNNDRPGRFLLTLDAPEPSQMPFHVDYPANDERIPAPMALERLKGAAAATGGGFYREEDLHKLPGGVHGQEGAFTFRRDAVLWNPLALLVVVALFAAEWIVRKLTNLS